MVTITRTVTISSAIAVLVAALAIVDLFAEKPDQPDWFPQTRGGADSVSGRNCRGTVPESPDGRPETLTDRYGPVHPNDNASPHDQFARFNCVDVPR